MKNILHHLRIHASADEVFRRLTTSEGLASWWSTEVEAEARETGRIRFTFHGDFNPVMRVTRLDPGEHVSWRCVGGHANWTESRFDFELQEIEEGEGAGETDLTFRQRYARQLDDATYGTYNFNWGHYLASLKQACETGEGTPFEPPE